MAGHARLVVEQQHGGDLRSNLRGNLVDILTVNVLIPLRRDANAGLAV